MFYGFYRKTWYVTKNIKCQFQRRSCLQELLLGHSRLDCYRICKHINLFKYLNLNVSGFNLYFIQSTLMRFSLDTCHIRFRGHTICEVFDFQNNRWRVWYGMISFIKVNINEFFKILTDAPYVYT